ncbi:response regulator transcription factor [Paenibacillus bovis]|uniref:DNA-binding response regulator n=1 Tax=Paenibacillus bovis TaxID=1616788 RepID=A0A172ZJT2_9BACL|nr:response regulator transcription factor [Paenibacillus bovis]ANF97799.1 DNA-binding response regulator [Paenibacillus bovis]
MPIKVLLIEDEKSLADMIAFFLQEEGYDTELIHDAKEAISKLHDYQPDIIVTDLMLPDLSGSELVQQIRRQSTVPVLMISANTMLNERLKALDNGADDFLCKPFSLKELDARIKALLRRSGPQRLHGYATVSASASETAQIPSRVSVNDYRHSLFVENQEVEVTQIEFAIMRELYHSPGKVFTRNELMDRIKGGDRAYLERTIDVHISNLRKKIERDPKNPEHILTVWGTGYKYVM